MEAERPRPSTFRPYNRTKVTERRRPMMSAWATFVTGPGADNVVPLRRG